MKGVVEIYGTNLKGEEELILQKENLTVVGFAENMVTMFTTPSSVTYPSPANDFILDSSSYTVQAISTSKNKEQFRRNQHAYDTSNLLQNTSFTEPADNLSGWTYANVVVSANSIKGFKDGVSGTLLDTKLSSGSFSQSVYRNGNVNGDGKFRYSDTFDYANMVFSIDLKWNENNPPAQLTLDSEGKYKSYTQVHLANFSPEDSAVFVAWDSSGGASLAKAAGSNMTAGIKYIGGGWYRVFVMVPIQNPIPSSPYTNQCRAVVSPCLGSEALATLDVNDIATSTMVDGSAGSIYVSRPQVEMGLHPTNYSEVSSFVSVRDEKIKFSLLNPNLGATEAEIMGRYDYYVFSGDSGLSLSSVYRDGYTDDRGVSAYIVSSNTVTPPPHPDDRELTLGARTPVEDAFNVEIIKGQNPFAINASATLMLSSYSSEWTYASGYIPTMGRHVAYLGAYTPYVTSNTAKAWVHYVSATTYEGYDQPLSSINLSPGIAGSQRIVDLYGHIALSANGTHSDYASPTINDSNFYKLIDTDFSSTGEVTYKLWLDGKGKGTASSGVDAPYLNIFGGVDTLGLWGLDLKAMREADISISGGSDVQFTRDGVGAAQGWVLDSLLPVYPLRKYKLYNKVVLTDNLVTNQGATGLPGIFGNYKDIKVTWRLKFL